MVRPSNKILGNLNAGSNRKLWSFDFRTLSYIFDILLQSRDTNKHCKTRRRALCGHIRGKCMAGTDKGFSEFHVFAYKIRVRIIAIRCPILHYVSEFAKGKTHYRASIILHFFDNAPGKIHTMMDIKAIA